MNKELEKYLQELEVKLNMKYAAENMGFEKKDRDYYVRKDAYKIHLLFKEDHLVMWTDAHLETAVVKNYIKLYNEIDRGIHSPKEFLYKTIKKFKEEMK